MERFVISPASELRQVGKSRSNIILELIAALEERFGFRIEDSEFSANIFETLGSLADFVGRKRAEA